MSMEGQDIGNGAEIARPESDAAATRREAANLAVAAMSRRVSGGGKTGGMVAGYARPGADRLHRLCRKRSRASSAQAQAAHLAALLRVRLGRPMKLDGSSSRRTETMTEMHPNSGHTHGLPPCLPHSSITSKFNVSGHSLASGVL